LNFQIKFLTEFFQKKKFKMSVQIVTHLRLACYSQLREVLETNHVNSYLENAEKAGLCDIEVRVAASNLEKSIFDSARSKISYKAAIINRRKEIMTATTNFTLCKAFETEQQFVAKKEACPVASGMFRKASELIQEKPVEVPEVKKTGNKPKFMSTAEKMRKLKKPKKAEKLSQAEENLMSKYLNPIKID
jgi:hypothetical protein